MRRINCCWIVSFGILLAFSSFATADDATPTRRLILVTGAEGTPEYGKQFTAWAERWQEAAERGSVSVTRIGAAHDEAEEDDAERLSDAIAQRAAADELWLVLIGHGTFDGRSAKFNLRGPDVSAEELAGWLAAAEGTVVVVNCASSSGPFVNRLGGPDRVVVTATKSGQEQNFARFGDYLSQAVGDASIDLDKDGQTSLFEAWLHAARRTQEFYEEQGRLVTEHSLLEDDGDARGARAEWFRGLELAETPADGRTVDGARAHQLHLVPGTFQQSMTVEQRKRRDELERRVLELRERKDELEDAAFYGELEAVLVELARVYEEAEAGE